MRNLITVIALIVSITGVFVSLAREELRCRLGLQSAECRSSIPNSNELTNHSNPTSPNVKESQSESSTTPVETSEQSASETRSPQKSSEPNPETTATQILKSKEESLSKSKPTEAINPEASPATSSDSQVSTPNALDSAVPPHEASQLDPEPNAAIANDSKPSQSQENQPIQVIPPSESPQP